MPFLHAHRRRVPTQDVDRSIVVGMCAEAAIMTGETSLAFAASTVHGSAFRTGLRGVGGIYLAKIPAAFIEFVGKDGFETEPPLIEDAPVKPGLLLHHATGHFSGPASRCRHVSDLQIFQDNRSEIPGNVERRLVRPIAANTLHARRQPGGTAERLCSAPRTLSLPGQSPLRAAPSRFNLSKSAGQGQAGTGRERQCVGDAAIYADTRADVYRGGVFNLAGETHMPAKRIKRNRRALDRPAQRARVTKFHPTYFGQAHHRPPTVEFLDFNLAPMKPERIVDALTTRRWVTGPASKEAGERLIEIAQSLLLAGLRNGRDPVKLGAEICQLPRLRRETKLSSGLTFVLTPPVLTLLKCQIVNQPAYARELPEQSFLRLVGGQLVSETTMDHLGKFTMEPKKCKAESTR